MTAKISLQNVDGVWCWRSSEQEWVEFNDSHIIYGSDRKLNKNKRRVNKALAKASINGQNKVTVRLYE